jgi:hypothetical protein
MHPLEFLALVADERRQRLITEASAHRAAGDRRRASAAVPTRSARRSLVGRVVLGRVAVGLRHVMQPTPPIDHPPPPRIDPPHVPASDDLTPIR